MKLTRRGKILAWVVAGFLAYSAGQAWVAALASIPRHHPVVRIRPKCLAAEDSAAHLKLLRYDDQVIRYGCYHNGY